jgi:ABC-type multidrug transport system ATPase subunit
MKIRLSNAGKRFNREWIFRKADLEFSTSSYAITGPNGSGKSTLLQCIGGMLQLSEGAITLEKNSASITENIHDYISFCAPYLELIEELTLTEFLTFHQQFKKFIRGSSAQQLIEETGLQSAAHKQIRYFSSGMKQRVKLAQAIYFDAAIVLLDEPCSNLDTKGIDLYHSLIEKYCSNRTVIVCSNDKVEYDFCSEIISIMSYKNDLQRQA